MGRGQQDRNVRRKMVQDASKWLNGRFWQKITSTLGQIISGTKCDRDNPILIRLNWDKK